MSNSKKRNATITTAVIGGVVLGAIAVLFSASVPAIVGLVALGAITGAIVGTTGDNTSKPKRK